MFVLCLLQRLLASCEGTPPLVEAFAMPLRLGLGHLGLLHLDLLGFLVDAFVRRCEGLLECGAGALLMPVRADKFLATLVGLERSMVNPALEAVFLNLIALPVHSGPLDRL